IRELAQSQMRQLAVDSPEFGRLMERLAPTVAVFPYQLLGEGKVVLRAAVHFDLTTIVPDVAELPAAAEHLRQTLVVDLFDTPQRERYRRDVMKLSQPGSKLTEREIAQQLGLTQPAVQYAKKLQRLLDELRRTDAYMPIFEPPVGGRLHRHRHQRYVFK